MVLLLAAVAVSSCAPASSHELPRGPQAALAADIAAHWPALQKQTGEFRDYTDGLIPGALGKGTRYGDSMLGLALLQEGLREHDEATLNSGLRALAFAVSGPRSRYQREKPSVFESMAVATAYNIARTRVPANPVFRAARADWERWLRRVRPQETIMRIPGTTRYANHYLIEALAVFELDKTGLRSSDRSTLLGGKRRRALRIYTRLVNRGIPALARVYGVRSRGLRSYLISDPPDFPLAYQGLALGLYGQAVRELGPRASDAAIATLRQAANASWLLAAPDGDVGYFGRSHEQAWAQSGTALGAEVAATVRGGSPAMKARYRALAERSLMRLRSAYGSGARGLRVIPALAVDEGLGARALDLYAGIPSFAGLTLVMLNWSLDALPLLPATSGALAADRRGHATLGSGPSTFVASRRRDIWFAVRQGRSITRHPDDLRYDFGLIALKQRGRGAAWDDVTTMRPITRGRADTVGPVLLRDGRRGLPQGSVTTVRRSGVVRVKGSFRTASGIWLRGSVRFRFVPTRCGVRVAFPAQQGDRFVYSVFLRSLGRPPAISRARLADARQVVTASPRPVRVVVDSRRYHSASDPQLVRARMRFHVRHDGWVKIDTCGARP